MNDSKKYTIHESIKAFENSSAYSIAKALEKSSAFATLKCIENSPALKAMKALENSSVYSAAKALEKSSAFAALKSLENSPALRAMKDIENSVVFKASKAFEKSSLFSTLKSLESSPALKAMKALENSSAFSVAKALEKSSLFTTLKSLENSPALKAMEAFENSLAFSAIKSLQDSSRFNSFNELADKFSSQMVGPLTLSQAYQVVTQEYSQTTGASDTERLEVLTGKVDFLVKKAPKGALSKEFYLGLILTLFIFWLSQISSMQSEEKMLLTVEQLEQTISQQLYELTLNEREETFYVVIRAVNLRVKPSNKSEVVSILYPNAKVRLTKRKSKWIRVEYFDYVENVYVSGWVYKKYLKMMGRNNKYN